MKLSILFLDPTVAKLAVTSIVLLANRVKIAKWQKENRLQEHPEEFFIRPEFLSKFKTSRGIVLFLLSWFPVAIFAVTLEYFYVRFYLRKYGRIFTSNAEVDFGIITLGKGSRPKRQLWFFVWVAISFFFCINIMGGLISLIIHEFGIPAITSWSIFYFRV